MNRDPSLGNMDIMEDHYNMPFYSTDQRHYMHGNTSADHMTMPQMGESTSSSSLHFMPSTTKGATSSKSLTNRSTLNSINQAYTHGINSPVMSPMGSPMMNSPTMISPMDQNSSNSSQMRYSRVSAAPVMSSHYDTPLMQHTSPYHQQNLQNHHSPTPNRSDLNHFNDISNTLTHISETDNSHNSNLHNNFVPTPPQTQSIGNNNSSIIATSQNYSSINCHSSNNWISSNIASDLPSHTKSLKNNGNHSNYGVHRNEPQFSYLNQQSHLSITSTPVNSSQSQNDRLTRLYQVPNPSCAKPTNDTLGNSLIEQNSKISLNENPEMLGSSIKKDCATTENKTIVVTTVKVIEQIVDIASKKVIKEKTIKTEEVIIPLTSVLDSSTIDATNISTSLANSHVGSSGNLGDISALSNSKSVNNQTSSISTEFNNNNPEVNLATSFDVKSEIKEKEKANVNENVLDDTSPSGVDENDEEERRQTASALLSLQTASNTNTPVKSLSDETNTKMSCESVSIINLDPVISAASKLNDMLNESENKEESDLLPMCERLGTGVTVMAKWKDKNFYPAQLINYIEANKWKVRFCADNAHRNLHESEMIRLEYLINNQDVMLSISSELCIRGTIKLVYPKLSNDQTLKFDLEHLDEETQKTVTKTYSLKEIFLNTEQGVSILNKYAKPGASGAVFADVDLDNIIAGKRPRGFKGLAENENDKKATKKSSDSSSESDGPTGRKRKRHNALKRKSDLFKNSDFRVIGQESSLCLSPRTNRSSLSMPAEELETILGPIPKQGSRIFAKINFLLTSGTRTKNVISENFHLDQGPSRSVPFDKEHLVKQILAGGGKVFETFQEMKESENVECLLISCTYNCTIKYMQCLAAGIPIVSHLWVINSCREGTLLERESYILPAGFSLITQSLSADRNTFKKSSILFRGMKFYFGSSSPEKLESLWAPVLYAAQATIVKQSIHILNSINRKMVDIIIGDATCSPKLAERAKQLKIPVVSTEYIVQCLINGRKLSYDACPIFSHTHK